MLYRVVRMVFQEETKDAFIDIFYKKQTFISAFPGCISVDLMDDKRDPMALATWSVWDHEDSLEAYRNSDLFKVTWDEVKPLFAGKPKAWSYTKHVVDENN